MKAAFIGHRKIERTQKLKERLTEIIKGLINNEKADTFLFGSNSEFDDLCYEAVTELRKKYKHIKRVYVRAEYEHLSRAHKEYIFKFYEDTFYPTAAHGAGALSYIKRNEAMIDLSDILITYCDEAYTPYTKTRSGTKTAVEYARKSNKRIINLF